MLGLEPAVPASASTGIHPFADHSCYERAGLVGFIPESSIHQHAFAGDQVFVHYALVRTTGYVAVACPCTSLQTVKRNCLYVHC